METDIIEILWAHDRWATENLLKSTAPLTDAQLDQTFEIGLGTLRLTLAHLLNVVHGWNDAIQQRPQENAFAERSSVADMLAEHGRIYEDVLETCRQGSLTEVLHLERRGRKVSAPRGMVLTHVFTHSVHHRAQALNMLRHLGVQPLPESSVFQWMLATGKAQLAV